MTSIDKQSSSLGSWPNSPALNPHYKLTFRWLKLCQVLCGGRLRQIKRTTHSLPSLQGPSWFRLVAPDRTLCMGQIECICRCLSPDRTWHKVNDPKVDLKWGFRGVEGRARAGARNLLVCGPDEPSWSWTQIWVQARMPAHSLNWTARSSDIQGGTNVSMLQLAYTKVDQPKPDAFRPRICHWFRYPIRNECQTAQLRPGKYGSNWIVLHVDYAQKNDCC